jgi:hypothetical protein
VLGGGQAQLLAHPHRQEQQGEQQQGDVKQCVPSQPESTREDVAVGIPGEEDDLIEEQAGGPHRGGAAHQRKDHPAEHQLEYEQERGAAEGGNREKHDQ